MKQNINKSVPTQELQAFRQKQLNMAAVGISISLEALVMDVITRIEAILPALTARTGIKDSLTAALNNTRKVADILSRIDTSAAKPIDMHTKIDVNNLLDSVSNRMKHKLPDTADIIINPARTSACVSGDLELLEIAVEILIQNAIDALGTTSGYVNIEATTSNMTKESIAANSQFRFLKPGTHVVARVMDSGYGMDNVVMENIFEPFFSTKGLGRGMGLTVAKGIIESHAGILTVDSKVSVGSTFSIYLPIHQEKKSLIEPLKSIEVDKTEMKGVTILIVDDEASICRYACRVLEPLGAVTYIAGDGLAGVDTFRAHADEINLVLLDMIMPRMNGDEVMQKIRAIRPNVKIILISGYAEFLYAGKLDSSVQPDGYMYKPFSTTDFLTRIREVLKAEKK